MTSAIPLHFLDLIDIPKDELRSIIETSRAIKAGRRGNSEHVLAGKTLAMIFEKESTRTRVSFEVATRQLGGNPIHLTGKEMQLGRGETIADTARVLSRYVDAIMIRILDHVGCMLPSGLIFVCGWRPLRHFAPRSGWPIGSSDPAPTSCWGRAPMRP